MTSTHPPMTIDLNSDLGEGFGPFRVGADEALFPLISSANVACGFHGGDPLMIERTIAAASAQGVAIGAHPGYPDRAGFGRRPMTLSPDEIRTDVIYQVGTMLAFCNAAGVPLQHVKAHGALYNQAVGDRRIADAIAAGVRAVDPGLRFFAIAGSELAAAGEAAGLAVTHEAFADRAYLADGSLAPRSRPGAVLHDHALVARRMVRLLTEGVVETIDGVDIAVPTQTICIHSDTPGAVELARAIKDAFADAGIAIRHFGDHGSEDHQSGRPA